VKLERYTAFFHLHALTTVPHLVQAEPFDHFMMQSCANIALMIQQFPPPSGSRFLEHFPIFGM
jgi:hypothetical protein